MTSDTETNAKPSPLWCAEDEPHAEHWAYNRFNGRDYCSGRPMPRELRTNSTDLSIADQVPDWPGQGKILNHHPTEEES